ncbi:hypothetical protein PG988_001756 [Apiospora saccharicola]
MGPLPPPTSSSPITLTIMENSVDAGLTFHRLLTTEEGWAGVGSYDVAPGVAMAILFGCSVPMVLRPLAPARYQVLGEAYIHGIMYGEPWTTSCEIIHNLKRLTWLKLSTNEGGLLRSTLKLLPPLVITDAPFALFLA